jgi:hypothetical protein
MTGIEIEISVVKRNVLEAKEVEDGRYSGV